MSRDPVRAAEYQRQYRLSEKGIAARRRELDDPTQKQIRREAQKRHYDGGARTRHYHTNENYKIKTLLRGRLARAVKVGSANQDLGATLEQLKTYIENLPTWQVEFTWLNLGKVWHLDHVKALGLFDLTDRAQFLQAANFKNLQPLSTEAHTLKTIEDNRLIRAYKKTLV